MVFHQQFTVFFIHDDDGHRQLETMDTHSIGKFVLAMTEILAAVDSQTGYAFCDVEC